MNFPTHCPSCNKRLDHPNDRALGVCAAPLCRGPFLRKKRMEEDARRRAWRANLAKETLARLRASAPNQAELANLSLPTDAQLVVVPSLDREVTKLPDDRRKEFVEHLEACLAKAPTFPASGPKHNSLLTEFAHRQGVAIAPAPAVVLNGCSTCRGYCCQHGDTKAFLTAEFLRWQMIANAQTVETLRRQYMDRLPNASVSNSCVFHAVQGCCLPRDIRSEICNSFHCEGLVDALEQEEPVNSLYSIAIATDDRTPRRIGFSSPDRGRCEVTIDGEL